jgi:hypothetical protein
MNITHIKNGSLYAEKASGKIWRVRSKANTSSVWVSHHSNNPELMKANSLRTADLAECQNYLPPKES